MMGKKKKNKHRSEHHAEHGGASLPLAGIAAMVAGQVNSPAGRQAIAAGLRMAADALGGKGRAPVPPVPPASPSAGAPPEPPRAEAAPSPPLPPEVARVIGTVAAGLERWANKAGGPKG